MKHFAINIINTDAFIDLIMFNFNTRPPKPVATVEKRASANFPCVAHNFLILTKSVPFFQRCFHIQKTTPGADGSVRALEIFQSSLFFECCDSAVKPVDVRFYIEVVRIFLHQRLEVIVS